MKHIAICAGALALAVVLPPAGAQAQDGLSGLHDKVRVGGKLCMADHYHDGAGSGSTRAQAQAAAIRSWQDFTAWEYSNRWGRYANALSKGMTCSGGPGNYNCSVTGRPCRY